MTCPQGNSLAPDAVRSWMTKVSRMGFEELQTWLDDTGQDWSVAVSLTDHHYL